MPIDKNESFTGLILVSGQDRPGITQSLMSTLSEFAVNILDIEQLVIRDRLLLTVLITLDEAHAAVIASDLDLLQDKLQLDIAIDFVQTNINEDASDNLRVVIVGSEIKPVGLSAVASEIARLGGNITAIKRTARNPVIAIEMNLTIPNDSIKKVQEALTSVAIHNHIDLAVEPGGSLRRSKRIVILDMDSTLISIECIDEIADLCGKKQDVALITKSAMMGEIDFSQSLIKRVSLLQGLGEEMLFKVIEERLKLNDGTQAWIEACRRNNVTTVLVSGGFDYFADYVKNKLGIDIAISNQLEIKDKRLTGKVLGRIVDDELKAQTVRDFQAKLSIDKSNTIVIGDGANDLKMLAEAQYSIAYHAKPIVQEKARFKLNHSDFKGVLNLFKV